MAVVEEAPHDGLLRPQNSVYEVDWRLEMAQTKPYLDRECNWGLAVEVEALAAAGSCVDLARVIVEVDSAKAVDVATVVDDVAGDVENLAEDRDAAAAGSVDRGRCY